MQTSVSSHLNIQLREYDARIRTFVPYYEEMLDTVAHCFDDNAPVAPVLVELGIGTGALSERCLRRRPDASLHAIELDPDILEMARERLGGHNLNLTVGSFMERPIAPCDAIVSSLALHHVRSADEKRGLYRRCREAIRPGGVKIIADCFRPSSDAQAHTAFSEWRRFLESSYSPQEADALLAAWSEEDTYFKLSDELAWLTHAGFAPEVIWRKDMFAVILCA